jgi:hypothetical protein
MSKEEGAVAVQPDWDVHWFDRGRPPTEPANPDYPNGVAADLSGGKHPVCNASLPYPAPRCGVYFIKCVTCGTTAMITTAGRRDDPRSVTLACKEKAGPCPRP